MKQIPLLSTDDIEVKIKGEHAVPYSDLPILSTEKAEKKKTKFTTEKIKAYFNL